MAPILYYLELSPPVRSVLLTAHAIGLELQLRDVNLVEQEHMTPEYLKNVDNSYLCIEGRKRKITSADEVYSSKGVILFRPEVHTTFYAQLRQKQLNPQHTVPTLDDDGFIICDSHAICSYIVGKYAKDDSLYPKDLKKRAMVDQRLHFDSGILFPRLRNIFFPIIFLGGKEIPVEKQEAMIQGYEFTNAFLENSDYLAGNSLTIADFCAITSLSSIVPVIPFDSAKYPNLSRWMNKMKSLPYYQEKNGNGADGVSSLVNQNLGR